MKKRADGRWQKRITLPNGKSKLLYSSESTEKMAMQDFNRQMLSLKQEQEDNELFENVAEHWKDEHFPTLQNNALKQYKPCYSAAVEYFKGYKIDEIASKDVNNYINFLASNGLAKKTIKNRLSVLSLIFQYAMIHHGLLFNPAVKMNIPKTALVTKRLQADKADENKICQNTDSLCGVLAYLYLVSGCRRAEALALTPADVDIPNKTISINKTVEWIGNKPQIKDFPKTEAGIRTIPVPSKLIDLLRPLMVQKYLFQNENGELIKNSQFTRMWDRYKESIGIECTPHQLRHSYATILFDAGIDVKTAQRWLGHNDIKTTLDIYTHLSENKIETMTNKVHKYLNKNY